MVVLRACVFELIQVIIVCECDLTWFRGIDCVHVYIIYVYVGVCRFFGRCVKEKKIRGDFSAAMLHFFKGLH